MTVKCIVHWVWGGGRNVGFKLEVLKLWRSKHLNWAILFFPIPNTTFLMRIQTDFSHFYLPWWMAILGDLYLLNFTLIAAKGILSAPPDMNLDFVSPSNQRREEVEWNAEEREPRREVEKRGWELHFTCECLKSSPWALKFNWRPAHTNVQYSALDSTHFLRLMHYYVTWHTE